MLAAIVKLQLAWTFPLVLSRLACRLPGALTLLICCMTQGQLQT